MPAQNCQRIALSSGTGNKLLKKFVMTKLLKKIKSNHSPITVNGKIRRRNKITKNTATSKIYFKRRYSSLLKEALTRNTDAHLGEECRGSRLPSRLAKL